MPPPGRLPVDGNVQAFQALDANTVLVLGLDGNLWLERAPFGQVPNPGRTLFHSTVAGGEIARAGARLRTRRQP